MIKNRQELLFIYDATDCNANGNPLDDNKPRIDEETGINIVTDVRLKRTIRDYLYEYKGFNGENGQDIFVREVELKTGGLMDGKTRAKDFNESVEEVLERALDIRLFGGVIPLNKDSITFTGPVQFNMGRSLNKVNVVHIKGTGAFASKLGNTQKTFREEYIIPYSLIVFHGMINENTAKHTKLTDTDVELLNEAIWNGTKNLITRSKMGHMPRLLLRVIYKDNQNFFIGDLQRKIRTAYKTNEEKVRGLDDFDLDITDLIDNLKKHKDRIDKVVYTCDSSLNLTYNGDLLKLSNITEVKFEEINY